MYVGTFIHPINTNVLFFTNMGEFVNSGRKLEDIGKSCRGKKSIFSSDWHEKRKFISLCNIFILCSEVTCISGVTVVVSYSIILWLFTEASSNDNPTYNISL